MLPEWEGLFELLKLSLTFSTVCMVSSKSADTDSVPPFSKLINRGKGWSSCRGLFPSQEFGTFSASIASYLSSSRQLVEGRPGYVWSFPQVFKQAILQVSEWAGATAPRSPSKLFLASSQLNGCSLCRHMTWGVRAGQPLLSSHSRVINVLISIKCLLKFG